MELNGHDQYWVKIDGSGRLTLRNRRFLRKYVPHSSTICNPVSHPHRDHPSASAQLPEHSGIHPVMHPTPSPITFVSSTPVGNGMNPTVTLTEPPTYPSDVEPVVTEEVPASPSPVKVTPHTAPDSETRRSRRSPCPRRMYEPETGQWIKP